MEFLKKCTALTLAIVFALPSTVCTFADETDPAAAKVVTFARLYCVDGIEPNESDAEGETDEESNSTLNVVEVETEEDGSATRHEISLEMQMTLAAKAKNFAFDFATEGFALAMGDISGEALSKQDGTDPSSNYSTVENITFSKELIKDEQDKDGDNDKEEATGFRIKLDEEKELDAGNYELGFKLKNAFTPKAANGMDVFSVDLAAIKCTTGAEKPPPPPEGVSVSFANHYAPEDPSTASSDNIISMMFAIRNGRPGRFVVPTQTSTPVRLGGYKMKFYFKAKDNTTIDVTKFNYMKKLVQYAVITDGYAPIQKKPDFYTDIIPTVEKLSDEFIKDNFPDNTRTATHVLTLTINDDPKINLLKNQMLVYGFGFYYSNYQSFIDYKNSYSYVDMNNKEGYDRLNFGVGTYMDGWINFPRVEVEDPNGRNISGDDIDDSLSGGTPTDETYTPDEGSGITIISTDGSASDQSDQSVLRKNPIPIGFNLNEVNSGLLDIKNLHSLEIEVRQKDSEDGSPNLQVWFRPAPVAENTGEKLSEPPEPKTNGNIFLLKDADPTEEEKIQLGPDGDGSKGKFDASLLPNFKNKAGADNAAGIFEDRIDFLIYPDWSKTMDGANGDKFFELEIVIIATVFKDDSYNYIEKIADGTEIKKKMVLYNYYDLPPFTVTKTLNAAEFNPVQ